VEAQESAVEAQESAVEAQESAVEAQASARLSLAQAWHKSKMGGTRLHCSSQCMSRNSMPTHGTNQYHRLHNLHSHPPMCSIHWMEQVLAAEQLLAAEQVLVAEQVSVVGLASERSVRLKCRRN